MQYNPTQDVAAWLDAMRGAMSRQQYMTSVLRQQIVRDIEEYVYAGPNKTESTKENNDEANHANGAIDALSQD